MKVLAGPQSREVVIDKFNIDMTRAKIACLRPRTWLNDEVINFYMCMLKERDAALCEKYPKRLHSHFFNSFFMHKLLQADSSGGGYAFTSFCYTIVLPFSSC
jgi:sentrin-specific protease 1